MTVKDNIQQPAGTLRLTAYDKAGAILWCEAGKNLIVTTGYRALFEALAGVQGSAITKVAVGTNAIAPTETDTQITNSTTLAIQSVEYPNDKQVRFNFVIGYNDAVGKAITEFGLLTNDGRLFSRKTRAAIDKTQYMSIVGQWDIII